MRDTHAPTMTAMCLPRALPQTRTAHENTIDWQQSEIAQPCGRAGCCGVILHVLQDCTARAILAHTEDVVWVSCDWWGGKGRTEDRTGQKNRGGVLDEGVLGCVMRGGDLQFCGG